MIPKLDEDALRAACDVVGAYEMQRRDMIRKAVLAYKIAEVAKQEGRLYRIVDEK